MKILFLLHAHPDLQAGGTEIFARDLFRTMRARGVEGCLAGRNRRAPTPAEPRHPVPGDRIRAPTNSWPGAAGSIRSSSRRSTCTA